MYLSALSNSVSCVNTDVCRCAARMCVISGPSASVTALLVVPSTMGTSIWSSITVWVLMYWSVLRISVTCVIGEVCRCAARTWAMNGSSAALGTHLAGGVVVGGVVGGEVGG